MLPFISYGHVLLCQASLESRVSFFCRVNGETGSSLLARPFIGSSVRFGPLPSHLFFAYVKLKEPSFARMQPARVRMQMTSMNPRPRLHPFRHAPRMSATIPRRDSKERSCLHSASFSGLLPKMEPLRQYGLAITNSSM